MARRYGVIEAKSRKWKKIARMNKSELEVFQKSLENDNQVSSMVYSHVMTRLSNI